MNFSELAIARQLAHLARQPEITEGEAEFMKRTQPLFDRLQREDKQMPANFKLKAPKVKLREKDVIQACLDLLRMRGYYPQRQHCGVFKTLDGRTVTVGEKGTPDYTVTHRSRPAFHLEVKRPGGDLSPEQILKHAEMRQGFGLWIVVVERVEDLAKFIAEHEGRYP